MLCAETKNISTPKIILLLVSGLMSCTTNAQTAADNKWHGDFVLGGSLTTGSNSSENFNADIDNTRASNKDKINIHATANYGSSTVDGLSRRTAQLFRAGGRYDYNLTKTVFIFAGGDQESNKLQNIDSRTTLNSGAGYKLVHSETSSWDLFAGVGYSSTKFLTQTKIFPPKSLKTKGSTLMFGEESSHTLSEATTIKQSLVVYPGQSEINTRSVFDASLSTTIIGGWTLNLGTKIEYESDLGPEFKSTSSLVTFGFGYKY